MVIVPVYPPVEFGNRDNDPVAVVMAFGATDHEAHVGAPPSWLGPSLRMHSWRKRRMSHPGEGYLPSSEQGERTSLMKCIVNGTVYTPTAVIPNGVMAIEGGIIQALGSAEELEVPAGAEVIDASAKNVVPGFIDIHFYGCGSHSLTDLDSIPEEPEAISSLLPRWGTSSDLISVLVSDHSSLVRFLEATAEAIAAQEAGAQPLGIHLEGPYLDPERRGAFPPELLREPNVDEMEDYLRAAKGYIRIVTLAPNLPHSRSVARRLHQRGVLASLGHSNASYEEAASALSEDFPLVTHVFNAMSGLHHRKPGVVGAVLTSEGAIGMLICDGIHVHPAAEACS